MRARFIPALIAVTLIPIIVAPVHPEYHAQQLEMRETQTISVNVDLVNVLFTVFDRKGKFITNLTQERVKAFEDNKPQAITNFSKETNLPLTIALLIDTSGSLRDRLRFEQEAAIEFFRSTLKKGSDKGILLTFDSGVELLQDYTDDPGKLADAVKRIRAGGGTSIHDALYLAASEKLAGQQGRRVIILISDGDDNSSRLSMTAALETAQRNDVVIYAISTNASSRTKSQEQEQGDKLLRRFAEDTGGRVFFPSKLQDLSADFENITEELRSQYSLAYRSGNDLRNGAFRTIRVEVADKNHQVRARSGYYALQR